MDFELPLTTFSRSFAASSQMLFILLLEAAGLLFAVLGLLVQTEKA